MLEILGKFRFPVPLGTNLFALLKLRYGLLTHGYGKFSLKSLCTL